MMSIKQDRNKGETIARVEKEICQESSHRTFLQRIFPLDVL